MSWKPLTNLNVRIPLSLVLIVFYSKPTTYIIALPVGSLNIDDRCEKKIAEDLSRNYPNPPEHAAHQIAREDFQAIKLRFGKEISLLNNKIRVPGLPDTERIDLPQ